MKDWGHFRCGGDERQRSAGSVLAKASRQVQLGTATGR